MTYHEEDLPFEEIRRESGDYFDNLEQAIKETGKMACHVWSVTEGEDDNNNQWYCYGPPHHYVNLIGLVVTNERHDFDTYYETMIELDN